MTRVNALVMRLFASPETMLIWVQLYDPDNDTVRVEFDIPISYVKSTIYHAALLELLDIVSRLIEDDHSIDEAVVGGVVGRLLALLAHMEERKLSQFFQLMGLIRICQEICTIHVPSQLQLNKTAQGSSYRC